LNILGGVGFNISKNISMDISAGVPVLKRDENSDGTKRAISFKLGLGYLFNM